MRFWLCAAAWGCSIRWATGNRDGTCGGGLYAGLSACHIGSSGFCGEPSVRDGKALWGHHARTCIHAVVRWEGRMSSRQAGRLLPFLPCKILPYKIMCASFQTETPTVCGMPVPAGAARAVTTDSCTSAKQPAHPIQRKLQACLSYLAWLGKRRWAIACMAPLWFGIPYCDARTLGPTRPHARLTSYRTLQSRLAAGTWYNPGQREGRRAASTESLYPYAWARNLSWRRCWPHYMDTA